MSHIKFDRPLTIRLIFSLQHKLFLFCVHLSAVILMILPFDMSGIIKFIIIIYIGTSFIHYIKNAERHYSGELYFLDGNYWVWTNNSDEEKLQLQQGFIFHPRLVHLTFINSKNKKYTWLFFPDSMDKDTFRRTRILVRYSTADTISPPV